MARASKRMRELRQKLRPGEQYPPGEALRILKETAAVKFLESVDVSVNLGVDPRRSDQMVRGATVLPNGTGKTIRVAVFAFSSPARKRCAWWVSSGKY
jgi:large subunit ribosomal protein L1